MESRNNQIEAANCLSSDSALCSAAGSIILSSTNNPYSLFGARHIPQDIFDYLAPFAFTDRDNEFLKHFYANPEFASRFKRHMSPIINKLLTHVIRGEQAEAEEMIKPNPLLLLETGIVKDYSGRKIQGTALQLALGAEDVKYHDDEECMVEMIHKHLKRLPNGEAIIAEQTAKQFPEGWEFKEEERAMRDSSMLNAVIMTISKSTHPADWENAIQLLKNYLAFENQSKLIQTGKHFNHLLLAKAFDLYKKNYAQFGGVKGNKNSIIWCEVIGTIERYVTAAAAQSLCTGLGTIVDLQGKLQRDLSLHNSQSGQADTYFPLDGNPKHRLGRDFAVYCYIRQYPGVYPRGKSANAYAAYTTYTKKKQKICRNYVTEPAQKTAAILAARA